MRIARLSVLAFVMLSTGACAIVQKATSPQSLKQEGINSCYKGNGTWDYEYNYCKYDPYKNAGDTEWKKRPEVSVKDKIKLPPLWR